MGPKACLHQTRSSSVLFEVAKGLPVGKDLAPMSYADPDERVILAVAGGNHEALGVLYDRHASAMLGLGARILGDTRDAEDLLHDVFVEVWRTAHQYSADRGRVRSWLLLRMRSRCIDRLRAVGRRGTVPVADPERAGDTVFDSFHDEHTDGARVRELLSDLPADQRDALLLGYFEGLSSTEIAQHLGIAVGTVKSRVAAGIAKLRSALCVTEPAARGTI